MALLLLGRRKMVVVIGDERQTVVGPYEASGADGDAEPSRPDPPGDTPGDADDGPEDEAGYGHGV
jgi:hypothetical protein